MSETARRIRLLVELKNKVYAGAGSSSSYVPDEAIRVRLERLVCLKQIGTDGDSCHFLPSALLFVAILLKNYEALLFSTHRKKDKREQKHE